MTPEMLAKITEWYNIEKQMVALKAKELEMRKEIFGAVFTDPTEGTSQNKANLPEGWVLQGGYVINRTIDRAAVMTCKADPALAPAVDTVFDFKPSLVVKEWKAADPSLRSVLADCVTEKPGTPSLKIILPKR